MTKLTKIVIGIAALAFAVAAADVHAGKIEKVKSQSGSENFTLASGGIWDSFKEWWRKEQQRKVDWAQHPCTKDEIKEVDGEMGVICRSKTPASCTVTVTEWEIIEGEGGPYRLPKKYTAVPPNCFGGAAPSPSEPQTP